MTRNKFAWQPVVIGYGVSLLAIMAAIIYALFGQNQREIIVHNLSKRPVELEVTTSASTFNGSIESGKLWRVSVSKSEVQQWNLKVIWKEPPEKLNVRRFSYEECDSLITISSDGYLTTPSECD